MGNQPRGKLRLGLHTLDYFIGPNPVAPDELEMAYDDINKDIMVFERTKSGTFEAVGMVAPIREELKRLHTSGIFSSAAAFVNNRKIYRFFFDKRNNTVRIDPTLNFDPLFKYYAIRDPKLGPNSEVQYITQTVGSGGVPPIIQQNSHLVEMYAGKKENGEDISIPNVGSFKRDIINGNRYVVEFYDATRALVDELVFQAREVYTTDLNLTPEVAVTDMIIQASQMRVTPDSNGKDVEHLFLYQGQDPSELQLNVMLKYADGRIRSITHEQTVGGRLSIAGFDTLDINKIDLSFDKKIIFEYLLIKDNSLALGKLTTTPNGAMLSPAGLSIRKALPIQIIQNVYNRIVRIIPMPYIEEIVQQGKKTGVYQIKIRFFAIFENGVLSDITPLVQWLPGYVLKQDDTNLQTLKIQVPNGEPGNFIPHTFTIQCANFNNSTVLQKLSSTIMIKVDDKSIHVSPVILSDNGNGMYTGRAQGIYKLDGNGTESLAYKNINDIYDDTRTYIEDKGTGAKTLPTHVRVRDLSDPNQFYSELVQLETFLHSGTYVTMVGAKNRVYTGRPVIFEFVKVKTDQNGVAQSVFTTGAIVHYVKQG